MDDQRHIKFKYVFSDNYNPVYCNGAFGGISTHGEIVVNFFLERMPIPNSVTNTLNSDGSLGGTIAIDPETARETVVRFIPTGIVLSEDSAKSIYDWLGNQIQELENRREIKNTETEKRD